MRSVYVHLTLLPLLLLSTGRAMALDIVRNGKDFDGIAWYRVRFSLRPKDAGKRVRLTLGAVDEACIIYLNGNKVHTRIFDEVNSPSGWNQAFSVDVTDHLNRRGENTLAVRVEDRIGAGGMWKPVYLAVGK